VERLVSEHIGRQWVVREARDMTEYASHPSIILSDGSYSVFAKFSEAANGLHQFEVELAGLRLLGERAGVLIPTPIGIVPVTGGSILVLEAVQEVQRAPRHWRQIGQTLARIHRNRWDRFGLERNGYIGPLYLDNTPMGDWPTFYAERRLQPYLRSATESGHLPPELIRQVEKLISRLPRLCGPEPAPTLLHGDAQSNNFISTDEGAVVIDPAVCYGHPEMDLAFIGVWLPAVPDDVYDGYRGEQPIDPGFWERRDLWRVWVYLAAVTVEGPSYLDRLTEAVEKYV
jgi:protein-ribulosamine 3-kinase